MTPADTVALALILLFGSVLGSGILLVLLVVRLRRRERRVSKTEDASWNEPLTAFPARHPIVSSAAPRPTCWLAIKSRDPFAVQTALALTHSAPCSWSDGLTGQRQLFIAPQVNGWVLVMGDGLPCPDEDVDVCFRFLLALSRKLGHVQFFQADRVLRRHAWARLEAGRVVRAYAWAGMTLWNQGVKTRTETALGVKCFAYGENVSLATWGVADLIAANVEKVSLLAGRWSMNPAAIDPRFWKQSRGIGGRLSWRY